MIPWCVLKKSRFWVLACRERAGGCAQKSLKDAVLDWINIVPQPPLLWNPPWLPCFPGLLSLFLFWYIYLHCWVIDSRACKRFPGAKWLSTMRISWLLKLRQIKTLELHNDRPLSQCHISTTPPLTPLNHNRFAWKPPVFCLKRTSSVWCGEKMPSRSSTSFPPISTLSIWSS